MMPQADEVKAELTDRVRFIDCGGNMESIACPYTGNPIQPAVWARAMSRAAGDDFRDLSFVCPCCGKNTSLNELVYHFPQGFARFSLAVRNPNTKVLSGTACRELSSVLLCPLRLIWRHT